jgi:hypothetical protein
MIIGCVAVGMIDYLLRVQVTLELPIHDAVLFQPAAFVVDFPIAFTVETARTDPLSGDTIPDGAIWAYFEVRVRKELLD